MQIGSNDVILEPVDTEDLPTQTDTPETQRVPDVKIKYSGLPPFATEQECARTSDFKHMKFSCEWFNPLQTAFLPEVEKDNNVVVSGRTSSGKTVVAEMVISYTLGEVRKKIPYAKAAYIAPLKALASEKEQNWTSPNHWFYQYKISLLTGDYILTQERKEELEKTDIICMSSEMLGSRIRRNKSEKNTWLTRDLKILVCDEGHLITSSGRGANLEVALMKFTKVNPDCRIVLLSATMPNVEDLGKWLTKLNNKESSVIKSEYRPTVLNWNYNLYKPGKSYKQTEIIKAMTAVNIVMKYNHDKFILFVHTKKTGKLLLEMLNTKGIRSEFHNADLNREDRERIEREFKSRDLNSLKVLVSTSTLAWGIDTPARRVIIVGLTRGLNYIDSLDIAQEGGRAGRTFPVKYTVITKDQSVTHYPGLHIKNVA